MTASPTLTDKDRIAELTKQLKDSQKELETKDKVLADLRPTVDIRKRQFHTSEQVVEFFGKGKLTDNVKAHIAQENRQRSKQGYDRIAYSDEEIAVLVDELAANFVADQLVGAPTEGWLLRTIKMVAPNGNLVQIPYEGQFNNIAGSLADGLVLYERKGYKRTEPMLCPAGDCFDESATMTTGRSKGKWAFSGYCSEDHFRRTEVGKQAPVVGV